MTQQELITIILLAVYAVGMMVLFLVGLSLRRKPIKLPEPHYPVEVVDVLPEKGWSGQTVLLRSDGKIYRWAVEGWWVCPLAVTAIVADKISASAITANMIYPLTQCLHGYWYRCPHGCHEEQLAGCDE